MLAKFDRGNSSFGCCKAYEWNALNVCAIFTLFRSGDSLVSCVICACRD